MNAMNPTDAWPGAVSTVADDNRVPIPSCDGASYSRRTKSKQLLPEKITVQGTRDGMPANLRVASKLRLGVVPHQMNTFSAHQ
jgi:hypothetical protein